MDCGSGNFGREGRWVPAGFQGVGGEIGGCSLCGMVGEVAGGLGEIGESIRRGFGSLWRSGLLFAEEPKVGRSLVVF